MPVETRTRSFTIIAQDPTVQCNGGIVRAQVQVPAEQLQPGPRGYRVAVVDYDSSRRVLYRGADLGEGDRFEDCNDQVLLENVAFHAQNVYAIIMSVLARFEAALGRRIPWSYRGHQIHVGPHAFALANAYYSDADRGLFFGYFPGRSGQTVYSCLSHDVVAHETAHALLDGLRECYSLPSRPDQAAFHEGLADVVAMLSVFSLPNVPEALLADKDGRVARADLTAQKLYDNALMGLAEQMGREMGGLGRGALRQSVQLQPDPHWREKEQFKEPHRRGEVFAAILLRTFVSVWRRRLDQWVNAPGPGVPVQRVAEDGSDAAGQLLTMIIRAIDYCPVVDLGFEDFLSAVLTADYELLPGDGKYKYRDCLRSEFARWDIHPQSDPKGVEPGIWEAPPETPQYACVHHEGMQRDGEEVFRFLWENRRVLGLYEDAYTRVFSVRPCVRVGPDGFVLRETVCQYLQTLDLSAGELSRVGVAKPKGMPGESQVRLNGGGVLLLDEFGRLKYHVRNRLQRGGERLAYLFENGIRDSKGRYGLGDGLPPGQRHALMHLRRAGLGQPRGEWQ